MAAARYTFRWICLAQRATITVTVPAANDAEAGQLASALIHDFALGRMREWDWQSQLPLIEASS